MTVIMMIETKLSDAPRAIICPRAFGGNREWSKRYFSSFEPEAQFNCDSDVTHHFDCDGLLGRLLSVIYCWNKS